MRMMPSREESEKENEPHATKKIKINTPVNTKNLINQVMDNLYKALEQYYEVVINDALVASLRVGKIFHLLQKVMNWQF